MPKHYWGAGTNYKWPNGSTSSGMWIPSIYPYAKNIQMFNCPSNTYVWTGQYIGNGFSYPINSNLTSPVNLSQIVYPAQCVVNACGWYYHTTGASNYENTSGTPLGGPSVKKWHNEGTNVVFVDGHAKWFQFQTIWRGNSTWVGTEWDGDAANSKFWTAAGT